MPYQPLHEILKELALKEMRNASIFEGYSPGLPPDDYGLVEMYCNDDNCDCRRVMFSVLSEKRNAFVAVIAYGWEDANFYRKWLKRDDPETIRELQGPVLNKMSPQSDLAPALLDMIRELVLKDTLYIARLKRHYQLFKEKVDPKHFRPSGAAKQPLSAKPPSKKRHRPRSTGD